MAGVYITSSDYNEIRARISVYIDDEMLPDSIISMDTFIGKAEDDVVARLDSDITLTSVLRAKVKRACILRAAAELTQAVPRTKSTGADSIRIDYESTDWMSLRDALMAKSDEEIDDVNRKEGVSSGGGFTTMITADGGRGKWGSFAGYRRSLRNQ